MKKAIVGIIMGSESDLEVMSEAAKILNQFGIPNEVTVVSAHRTPDRMVEYAKEARDRGIKLIIAGAGGAAHLPGMTASLTPLPVIGVPVKTQTMDGVDSLLSIAQMPGGIPVATVAVNGGKNAGLLAVEILALSDQKLAAQYDKYRCELNESVIQTAQKLETDGWEDLLRAKGSLHD